MSFNSYFQSKVYHSLPKFPFFAKQKLIYPTTLQKYPKITIYKPNYIFIDHTLVPICKHEKIRLPEPVSNSGCFNLFKTQMCFVQIWYRFSWEKGGFWVVITTKKFFRKFQLSPNIFLPVCNKQTKWSKIELLASRRRQNSRIFPSRQKQFIDQLGGLHFWRLCYRCFLNEWFGLSCSGEEFKCSKNVVLRRKRGEFLRRD